MVLTVVRGSEVDSARKFKGVRREKSVILSTGDLLRALMAHQGVGCHRQTKDLGARLDRRRAAFMAYRDDRYTLTRQQHRPQLFILFRRPRPV
jgi:hypothetical protein